jgi:integrase
MDRGVPIMANRVLAHTKRLFSWAAGRDLIENDPAAHIERPGEVVTRDRVLTDRELVAVWRAAEGTAGPFGAGVHLLIATGARREEVFGAAWAEVETEPACIRLPPARNKVKEPRAIPLSPLALGVLDELPRLGRFVVSTRGDKAFANAGHGKAKLDATIARQRAEVRLGRPLAEGEEPAADDALAAWRLHDLRRTVATGLQRLGVRLEVIEAVLGHTAGTRAGIVAVYQRHRYEAEAREALATWAAHVQRLLDGDRACAEVVPLRRA